MRNLYVISINHQSCSAEERISFDLSDKAWDDLSTYIAYTLDVEGHVLLRTCNRVELYYDAENNVNKEVAKKWMELAGMEENPALRQFQFCAGYEESINHLLHLSAGLKSAIFGDDQILSQLKKAFEAARSNKTMSTLLERAYQTLMRFHKQICKRTAFRSHTVSLAYQALKSARFRFGADNLKTKNVLIIGAGDMAAQVVKYIPKFTFKSVSISNRTKSKAEKLAKNGSIAVVDYASLEPAHYDIIVSCTDQGFSLVEDWSEVEYYIDLSLYSAQVKHISASHILLGDLQDLMSKRDSVRMKSLDMVHPIIDEMREEYVDWCIGWSDRMKTRMALV